MLALPFPIAEPPLNAVRFTPRATARLVALGVTGAHDVTIDKVTAGKPRPRPRHGERPHHRRGLLAPDRQRRRVDWAVRGVSQCGGSDPPRLARQPAEPKCPCHPPRCVGPTSDASRPWTKSLRGLCPVENFQFSRELRSRHLIPEVLQAVCPQPGRPWTKSLRGLCPVENFQFSRELRSRHLIPEVLQAVCPQPATRLIQGGRFLAKRRWSRRRWFPHRSHGEPHLSHAESHGPGEHDRRSGESGDRQHLRPPGDAVARRDHHDCRRTCRRPDGNGCPRSEHVWLFRHFHGSPMKRTPSSGPIKWPPPHASARMSTSSQEDDADAKATAEGLRRRPKGDARGRPRACRSRPSPDRLYLGLVTITPPVPMEHVRWRRLGSCPAIRFPTGTGRGPLSALSPACWRVPWWRERPRRQSRKSCTR